MSKEIRTVTADLHDGYFFMCQHSESALKPSMRSSRAHHTTATALAGDTGTRKTEAPKGNQHRENMQLHRGRLRSLLAVW